MIISTAEEMNPRKRSTMEDVHVVHEEGSWGCNDDKMTFVGVYDGHGGRGIVEFLEDNMADNIARELNHTEPVHCDDNDDKENNATTTNILDTQHLSKKLKVEEDNATINQRLERAFLITDIQSRSMDILTSGATVVICLIKKNPTNGTVTIHAANAGDARAVLSCTPLNHPKIITTTVTANNNKSNQLLEPQEQQQISQEQQQSSPPQSSSSSSLQQQSQQYQSSQTKLKKSHRLTNDHRATDPSEIKRIELAGGFVVNKRVLGILAVSRSLGDHGLKEYVVGMPDIQSVEVNMDVDADVDVDVSDDDDNNKNMSKECGDNDDIIMTIKNKVTTTVEEFIIIACDGMWDVMEDDEACQFIRDNINVRIDDYNTNNNNNDNNNDNDDTSNHNIINGKHDECDNITNDVNKKNKEDRQKRRKQNIAQTLCNEAIRRGSTDNVTVVVVWL